MGKCPVTEQSGCRPRPGCRRSETRPRSSREWPYRFNTFSTENEIINKEFVVASMASAQKRNVGMDVCKPGRSYSLVKVHKHLEQRRDDEEKRNYITRMRINLVVLLYLLDDVLTTKKSGKTAFCQDRHNSSVQLIRESRLYLIQKSLPEYIHIRW